MTKVDNLLTKPYNCNECDKPYIKKGAMKNHLKRVHNISKSPINKGFMDITTANNPENNEPIKGKYACLNCDKTYSIKKITPRTCEGQPQKEN